jgi:hypothetical protein
VTRVPRHFGRILAACGLLIGASLTAAATAAPAKVPALPKWTGGAPLPAAPHLGLKRNEDGEPGMGVAPDGQFWIASDIAPYAADDPRVAGGVLSGGDVWTSTDGGQTYHFVSDPFSPTLQGSALAGEDTDLTVAPVKNASGHYTVYATSLWVGASSLAWSTDGGKKWNSTILGGIPAQDRPWLAATGPCDVYLMYHQLPSFTPTLNKYDVCSVPLPTTTSTVLNYTSSTSFSASTFPGLTNAFGKQVVDNSPASPHRGNIYVPMIACSAGNVIQIIANAESQNGCTTKVDQVVGVSTDGGNSFTDYRVVLDTNNQAIVWPNTVATDAAGTVYFAWFDNSNAFLDISHDGGKTWSAPKKLNASPSKATAYPTVTAGSAGHVVVAWYGTNKAGDANDPKVMGAPSKPKSTPWYVYVAESSDGGATFAQSRATGVVHRGELCTHGSGCADTSSRNLLDDFGASISPTTGLTSVTYTSDQPDGTAGHAFTGYTTMLPAAVVPPVTTPPKTPRPSTGPLATTGGLPVAGLALLAIAASVAVRRLRTKPRGPARNP